jgi:hypothetical protein
MALALAGGAAALLCGGGVYAQTGSATGSPPMPLPLRPYERVVSFADGKCAMLDHALGNGMPSRFRWFGACRFGLAHGSGLMIGADQKPRPVVFHYGTYDRRPDFPGQEKTYWSDRSLNPNVSAVSIGRGSRFDARSFSAVGQQIYLSRWEGTTLTETFFGVLQLTCPFTAFQDAPSFIVTAKARADAEQVCRLDPGAGGLFVLEVEKVFDIASSTQAPLRPPRENVWVCAKEAVGSPADCTAMITVAIAPYLDRINAVIAADAGARGRAVADVTERFRPLEAAFRNALLARAARAVARSAAKGE